MQRLRQSLENTREPRPRLSWSESDTYSVTRAEALGVQWLVGYHEWKRKGQRLEC